MVMSVPLQVIGGMAVIQSKPFVFGATPTFGDGTRSFDWDSRSYSIELEEDEEE